jgi:hypothetical protein
MFLIAPSSGRRSGSPARGHHGNRGRVPSPSGTCSSARRRGFNECPDPAGVQQHGGRNGPCAPCSPSAGSCRRSAAPGRARGPGGREHPGTGGGQPDPATAMAERGDGGSGRERRRFRSMISRAGLRTLLPRYGRTGASWNRGAERIKGYGRGIITAVHAYPKGAAGRPQRAGPEARRPLRE